MLDIGKTDHNLVDAALYENGPTIHSNRMTPSSGNPEIEELQRLLSDDENEQGDSETLGRQQTMQGIEGDLTIEKFLMKIPPNIEKAELHGRANSIFNPKLINKQDLNKAD